MNVYETKGKKISAFGVKARAHFFIYFKRPHAVNSEQKH